MIEQLFQKASHSIEKSGSILIIPDQLPDNDSMGSSFGLAIFLESLGKRVEVLTSFNAEEKLRTFKDASFKTPSFLIPEIFDPRAFVIKINTAQKSPDQLKYEVEEGFLKIIIDSEKENFTKNDISFEYTPFNHDLVILVGITSLKNIGDAYFKNKDFFSQTQIININNRPVLIPEKDTQKSPINLINQSCASKSELILPLMERINAKLINGDVANWLGWSLVEATDNLQKNNLTSQTTNMLPALARYGAKKELIIKATLSEEDDHVFNFATKILAQKEFLKIKNNLFIKIPRDIITEEINKKTLVSLAREVSLNLARIENIFLFLEKDYEFIVVAHIKNNADFEKIGSQIGGTIYENCIFIKIKAENIDQAQQKIITLLNISW